MSIVHKRMPSDDPSQHQPDIGRARELSVGNRLCRLRKVGSDHRLFSKRASIVTLRGACLRRHFGSLASSVLASLDWSEGDGERRNSGAGHSRDSARLEEWQVVCLPYPQRGRKIRAACTRNIVRRYPAGIASRSARRSRSSPSLEKILRLSTMDPECEDLVTLSAPSV